MSSKLYDEIAALDRAIADRWKARSRDDPKRKLKPRDVKAIFDPLMKLKGTITERESRALAKMFFDGEWSDRALALARAYIEIGVEGLLFQNGGDVLVTPDEFKTVTNALGTGMTGNISFQSPGTNFSYVPGHYQAIQRLISESKIFVFDVRMHGLDILGNIQTLGQYRSDANYLYVFAGRPPAQTAMSIVHEVTHTIQDWQDLSSKNKYIEADAFIAGAVADISQGGKGTATLTDRFVFPPAMEAAKLVVAGKANTGEKAWTDAYDLVVKDVEKVKVYKKDNEKNFESVHKNEGTSEKDKMNDKLAELAKKTP